MDKHQEYHIIKETHSTASDLEAARETARSRNTSGVGIAAASGVPVKDYVRTVHDDQSSEVTWALDNARVRFAPEFAEEEITVAEVLRDSASIVSTGESTTAPYCSVTFSVLGLSGGPKNEGAMPPVSMTILSSNTAGPRA